MASHSVLPRILIVEDDQTFRETVCELLRDVGYKVKGARTLRKATKRLTKHDFDLVLTDVHIGHNSGFEVIQITHEKRPAAKIMMMSSRTDPELVEQGLQSGAARFIAKPFRLNELLNAIEELLDNQQDETTNH
jgi:two-component system, NtrC family, response regulator PilR